jgi:hypothetical protein
MLNQVGFKHCDQTIVSVTTTGISIRQKSDPLDTRKALSEDLGIDLSLGIEPVDPP